MDEPARHPYDETDELLVLLGCPVSRSNSRALPLASPGQIGQKKTINGTPSRITITLKGAPRRA